jgi:DNA helicase-2/ATP-dependent DNA helicase PcrA
MLDANIFGDVDSNEIRYKKPLSKSNKKPRKNILGTAPKNLKKLSETSSKTNLFDSKLTVGNIVNHLRFGNGEVIKIEGKGADLKAEINFKNAGIKKLLLRFAKLEILS